VRDASEQRWRTRLTAGALHLVAYHEDTPAGMVGALHNPDGTVELVSLWVAPAAHGRGLGDALVATLLDWAGERTVRLEVFAANSPALDLYRRNGFVTDAPGEGSLTMTYTGPVARWLAELNAQIWRPYSAAHAAGDTEAFLALHAPDLIRAGGPGKTVQDFGSYALASRKWRADLTARGSSVAIEFRFTERITDGALASERGVYRLTGTRADGDSKVFHGHFHTFTRKTDGRWRIVVDYDTTDAEPADFETAADPEDFTPFSSAKLH
jgi:GNAT superfamily N-acetyltransferase/ketosteroid isomerase-like protein